MLALFLVLILILKFFNLFFMGWSREKEDKDGRELIKDGIKKWLDGACNN